MSKATEAVEKYELHPKVAMSVLAGAAVNVLIGPIAALGIIDLLPYQSDLVVIVSGLIGYLVPSK